MIIACDFDGTLYRNGELNAGLISRLRQAQRKGDTVILWTCREGRTLQDAFAMLAAAGFRPDYVNRNAPEAIRRMGHDSRKIFADIYIDDKASR